MIKSLKTYHSFKSLEVPIGSLVIGGSRPVTVQSMTNTNTLDTKATVKQVIELANTGCDIVRITTPSIKEAENLAHIKREIRKQGVDIPIVADIHFTPKPAEVAARLVEKVRINPGNYVDRNRGKVDWTESEINEAREKIAERLLPLLKVCKENGTAIRIGTNHGSLSERILAMYGNTPRGMVESALEFIHICMDNDFHNLVLSMKASNVKEMTAANLLLVDEMIREGYYYPVHLGVTEAGNAEEARIKSAAGIGTLLALGIGDTVRVSLAEDPVEEVPVAKKLISFYGRKPEVLKEILQTTQVVKLHTDKSIKELSGTSYPVVTRKKSKDSDLFLSENGRNIFLNNSQHSLTFTSSGIVDGKASIPGNIILRKTYHGLKAEDVLLKASAEFAILFRKVNKAGIWLENENEAGQDSMAELSLKILQGLGLRFSKAEFVACPSCGRTKFNLFESFNRVKEKTAHLKGLQIAVMGCIVNGPGEMGDADYGYVGAGPGKVTLYKDGIEVIKNASEEDAVEELINLIKESGDWINHDQADQ